MRSQGGSRLAFETASAACQNPNAVGFISAELSMQARENVMLCYSIDQAVYCNLHYCSELIPPCINCWCTV